MTRTFSLVLAAFVAGFGLSATLLAAPEASPRGAPNLATHLAQ